MNRQDSEPATENSETTNAEHDKNQTMTTTLTLTDEDEQRLKDDGTVNFSHLLEGYRLEVTAEEIETTETTKAAEQ